jgi:hypothetical protein
MKIKHISLIISLVLLATACKKETFELPEGLVTAKSNLTSEFESLNQKMASAVVYTISINADTTLVRAKLVEMVNSSSDITDFAWITPAGIMQIIEPSIYYGSQGTDISNQDHVIRAFNTKLPVMSKTFLAVEGYYAAIVLHPVLINNSISGGISALFFPEQFLEHIIKPVFEGKEFEMWVMEKGGRILFDQDAMEIGRNLFTDSLYTDFPELLVAGEKIDSEESGTTRYSFYRAGTMETVTKLTYWTTFELYGTQWKLVWVKPE